MNIEVNKWHGVAAWTWTVGDETCGICRNAFDAHCADCRLPGDDCPPVWGKCKHSFHMHCIYKWISNAEGNKRHCPMCRRPWEFM